MKVDRVVLLLWLEDSVRIGDSTLAIILSQTAQIHRAAFPNWKQNFIPYAHFQQKGGPQ